MNGIRLMVPLVQGRHWEAVKRYTPRLLPPTSPIVEEKHHSCVLFFLLSLSSWLGRASAVGHTSRRQRRLPTISSTIQRRQQGLSSCHYFPSSGTTVPMATSPSNYRRCLATLSLSHPHLPSVRQQWWQCKLDIPLEFVFHFTRIDESTRWLHFK